MKFLGGLVLERGREGTVLWKGHIAKEFARGKGGKKTLKKVGKNEVWNESKN